MVDPVVPKRPLQRFGDVLLADHLGEDLRTVAAVQRERGFGALQRGRVSGRGGGRRRDVTSPGFGAGRYGKGLLGQRSLGLVEHREFLDARFGRRRVIAGPEQVRPVLAEEVQFRGLVLVAIVHG